MKTHLVTDSVTQQPGRFQTATRRLVYVTEKPRNRCFRRNRDIEKQKKRKERRARSTGQSRRPRRKDTICIGFGSGLRPGLVHGRMVRIEGLDNGGEKV